MNDDFVRYSAGGIERCREYLCIFGLFYDTHHGFCPEGQKKESKNHSTAGDPVVTRTALFPMKMQKCYTLSQFYRCRTGRAVLQWTALFVKQYLVSRCSVVLTVVIDTNASISNLYIVLTF